MGGGGVVISVEPARLVLESDGKGLTADQAREVAALLLGEAAGELEEVIGVMSTTCPNGTPWCTAHEHDASQCVSRALTVEERPRQRLADPGAAWASRGR